MVSVEKAEDGYRGEVELRRQAQAADNKPRPSGRCPPSLQRVDSVLPQPSPGDRSDEFDELNPNSSDEWLLPGLSRSSRASSPERRER